MSDLTAVLRDAIKRAKDAERRATRREIRATQRVSVVRRAYQRLQQELSRYVGSHRASQIAKQIVAEEAEGKVFSKNS